MRLNDFNSNANENYIAKVERKLKSYLSWLTQLSTRLVLVAN